MARKAKRQQLIAAIEIAGPSGAGKTLGGLLIGYGMMKEKYPEMAEAKLWDKIGLVDTEHERSLVYEGMEKQGVKIGEFWFEPLTAPYTYSRYEKAVKSLKEAGCEVVIIDSISHSWESDGGMLDLQQSKGGTFQSWRDVNPVYNDFISLFTGEKFRIHTISTVRQKQSYEVERSEIGKLEVKKVGLKHVQRDSLEYEFQIVFNVNMDHVASTSKDNSGLFEEIPAKLSPEHGKKLIQWLEKGIDVKGEEEKIRLNTLDMIGQFEQGYGQPVTDLIRNIETKTNQKLQDLPKNLVDLAFTRVNDLVKKLEEGKVEA